MNTFLILGIALLCSSLSACASLSFFYSAEAIEGWVVDAETEKPLEGVIVVAHWQLRGGFEGGYPIGELKIFETVTDQNGRYTFPTWGPKFALMGHLKSQSPEMLLFKQGYKYRGLDNQWFSGRDLTKSDWNKKTVKLERFTGTLEQYAFHLESLNYSLWIVGNESEGPCSWKSFPRLLRALEHQEAEFRRAGLVQGTVVSRLRANDSNLKAAGCGSVNDVLKR